MLYFLSHFSNTDFSLVILEMGVSQTIIPEGDIQEMIFTDKMGRTNCQDLVDLSA
jgi:hypothetical protein